MSKARIVKMGLRNAFARSTFVVFVSRDEDMKSLQERGAAPKWTVPSSARPGDRVLVYKPGKGAGWPGKRRPPFEAFVAVGIVYEVPQRLEEGVFNAVITEIQNFPNAVCRSIVAGSFPEWQWLRSMQGMSGVRVPKDIEDEFITFIGRLAFCSDSSLGTTEAPKAGPRSLGEPLS
jgi:hypothetical protein